MEALSKGCKIAGEPLTIRFWGDGADELIDQLSALRPESVRCKRAADPASSDTLSQPGSDRAHDGGGNAGPSPFERSRVLLVGVLLVALLGFSAQLQIGGVTWRWDCEEYAAEQAIDEYLKSGGPLKNAYRFTGVWFVGLCRATYA